MKGSGTVFAAIEWLGRLYPVGVDPDEDLVRSLEFLETDVRADVLARASRTLGLVAGGLAATVWLLAPVGVGLGAAAGCFAAGLLAAQALVGGPVLLATARRTSALGSAPDLIARTVLRMRLAPSPEAAAVFAAESDDNPLARNLRLHVCLARGYPESVLGTFAAEWADWFPALGRGVSLVEAAGEAPDGDRERLLDRALDTVLEGTESAMRSFASDIRGPAMGLYAFGVLLPTALVSLLPAASMAGLPVTALSVALLYDLLLPLGLLVASAWLLARRPVAFRPPRLEFADASVPDRWELAAIGGISAGVAGWLGASLLSPGWAAPVAALGYGLGVGLVVRYRPAVDVYERVRAVEDGLSDAISLVGRRVTAGAAAEVAVCETAAELDGEIATVLDEAARQQRLLGAGLREALLGRNGAAAAVPSPRLQRSASLFARAAEEGPPAGEALVALGDHLADLEAVQERARHNLDAVCSTLRSTAGMFGPLVAGATVALADGMAGQRAFVSGGADPIPWLGLVVGGYVLAMAAILATLSLGLRRGLDGPLVAHRVGRTLLLATTTMLVSYALASTVA
ncbi:MAG: type II secretion system protein [Haloarculaceae archaeon]